MFPSAGWSEWREGLDDAQLAVALHGPEPLVVLAGAGTGKTRALVSRVAALLESGVPPERLLLLTFTRRAASEMLARAASLVGLRGERRPWGGTFHAVAYRFVAAHAGPLGFPGGPGLIGPDDASDLIELMRPQSGLSGTATRLPRSSTLVEIYSRCVNTCRPLNEVLVLDFPWCEPHLGAIADLFRAFTARKAEAALIDFDDLLLYWRALLADPVVGAPIAGMFDYVLVDEYQDVNRLQVDIVRLLAPEGRGLTVVGDEAQAIFGFRGAGSQLLRELVLSYPGASTLELSRNFRSHQGILDVANAVRPGCRTAVVRLLAERGRGPKPKLVRCQGVAEEARAIAGRALEAYERGTLLREQAVLVRAAHHSDLVEVELTARKIPYRKYGGLRFLEAAHVKDFVSTARLLDNPHDEIAWYRLLRLHREIGPAHGRALSAAAASSDDILANWPSLVAGAPAEARAGLSVTLSKLAVARPHTSAGERAEAVLEVLRPLVVRRYPDAAVRLGDLDRLVGVASTVRDMAAWLADLVLGPPQSTSDLAGPPHLDDDYLVISTVHSAKGLEWPVVHIPRVLDGFIPIDMALGTPEGLQEERRLFYVALTRARDELYLYAPLRLHYHPRGDRHGYATLSRFVDQEVLRVLDIVEQPTASPEVTIATAAAGAHRVSVDLSPLWG